MVRGGVWMIAECNEGDKELVCKHPVLNSTL